jgi:hypothetical protein
MPARKPTEAPPWTQSIRTALSSARWACTSGAFSVRNSSMKLSLPIGLWQSLRREASRECGHHSYQDNRRMLLLIRVQRNSCMTGKLEIEKWRKVYDSPDFIR